MRRMMMYGGFVGRSRSVGSVWAWRVRRVVGVLVFVSPCLFLFSLLLPRVFIKRYFFNVEIHGGGTDVVGVFRHRRVFLTRQGFRF